MKKANYGTCTYIPTHTVHTSSFRNHWNILHTWQILWENTHSVQKGCESSQTYDNGLKQLDVLFMLGDSLWTSWEWEWRENTQNPRYINTVTEEDNLAPFHTALGDKKAARTGANGTSFPLTHLLQGFECRGDYIGTCMCTDDPEHEERPRLQGWVVKERRPAQEKGREGGREKREMKLRKRKSRWESCREKLVIKESQGWI